MKKRAKRKEKRRGRSDDHRPEWQQAQWQEEMEEPEEMEEQEEPAQLQFEEVIAGVVSGELELVNPRPPVNIQNGDLVIPDSDPRLQRLIAKQPGSWVIAPEDLAAAGPSRPRESTAEDLDPAVFVRRPSTPSRILCCGSETCRVIGFTCDVSEEEDDDERKDKEGEKDGNAEEQEEEDTEDREDREVITISESDDSDTILLE